MRAAKTQPATLTTDPLLEALARAPLGDELSDEELEILDEGRQVDRWAAAEQVTAEIRRRCPPGR